MEDFIFRCKTDIVTARHIHSLLENEITILRGTAKDVRNYPKIQRNLLEEAVKLQAVSRSLNSEISAFESKEHK